MKKQITVSGIIAVVAAVGAYVIFNGIYHNIDQTDFMPIQIGISLVSILAFCFYMLFCGRESQENWTNYQMIWSGILSANVYYFSGLSAVLLGIITLVLLWNTKAIHVKIVCKIFYVALLTLEVYSIVLLCYARIGGTESKQVMESATLDILLIILTVSILLPEKIWNVFDDSWKKELKAYSGIFFKNVCLFIMIVGAIGIMLPFGWYKMYLKGELNAVAVDKTVYATDQTEYVRALRSSDVLLPEGEYSLTIHYQCETDQQFEVLHVDGTEYPPTILSGVLSKDETVVTTNLTIPTEWDEGNFCFYLLYNGVGLCDIERVEFESKTNNTLVVTKDQFTSRLVGYREGPVDGFFNLQATYAYDMVPKNSHYQICSSEFDSENYTYRIYRIGREGEEILVCDAMDNPGTSRVQFDLDGIEHVVVELYRRGDDGNEVLMEINNHTYIYGAQKAVLFAMVGVAGVTALLFLFTVIGRKSEKKYVRGLGQVLCLLLLILCVLSAYLQPKNQLAYAYCYVAVIVILIVKGIEDRS